MTKNDYDDVIDDITEQVIVEIQAAGKPLESRTQRCADADGIEISEVIREMGLHASVIISVMNGKPVPQTERVKPGETVRLISVVSGG